jgi:hypothetical protein
MAHHAMSQDTFPFQDFVHFFDSDVHTFVQVYYSEETAIVDIASARGKCVVRRQVHEVAASEQCAVNHVFFCSCIHDPKTGTVKQVAYFLEKNLAVVTCSLRVAYEI